MRKKKKTEFPKTRMPVPPVNVEIAEKGNFLPHSDETFITSGYCDADQIQWLYLRQVTRGFSDSELMTCDVCGRKLFVNEIRGHYMSSTTTPEVVGWVRVKQDKTLELALSESSYEMLGEDLLESIRRLNFSGSISKVSLYLTSYITPHGRRPEKSELSHSLKLIRTRKILKPKEQPKRAAEELQKRKEDLSESPLRPDPRLIEKYREQTKRFLKNPPANAYKRSRTQSLRKESKTSGQSRKISQTRLKAPPSLLKWSHLARE